MGLRDRLKQTAKVLLGRPEAARPDPTPASSASAPAPSAPVAARPAPASPAPVAPAPAPTTVKIAAVKPLSAAAKASPLRAGLPADLTEDGYLAVAASDRVAVGKSGTYPLSDGTVVAVFRHAGRLYVIDNACAHEDGPVGEGDIDANCVRCPYHDWEYDFTTGACRTDPERALATYAVREQGGFIWVGPQLTEGTGARGGDHNDGLETITR